MLGHALRTPLFEFNALPAATQVANDDDDYFPDDDYEQFLRETQPVAGLPMRPSTLPFVFVCIRQQETSANLHQKFG